MHWRSHEAQELVLREQRCLHCREPLLVTARQVDSRRSGPEGAVRVLDAAPARLEAAGFIDEAALLDRTFEGLRYESRQTRAHAREQREEALRLHARLAAQGRALRWTLRQLARRRPLDGRQRRLLAELNHQVGRAEWLVGSREE
jgi:hypothetical protein